MSEFEKSEKMEKEKIGKEAALVSRAGFRTAITKHLGLCLVALSIVVAVGLLSSCATSGKSETPDDTGTPPTITPPDPGEPDGLGVAQTQASDASDAAMTASDAAKAAADAAEMAGDMLATSQTGSDMYEMHLKAANDAYQDAMAAYNEAKKQSEAAQAATTVVAAVTAAVKAVTAQGDAETAMKAAEEARDKAMMAANDLLKIDGTMKSIGDTTVDADAASSEVTIDGQTTHTGFQSDTTHTVLANGGAIGMDGDPTKDLNPYVAPTVGTAVQTFEIGKTLDSSDDTARLMIVTKYAGLKTVKVAGFGNENKDASGVLQSDGRIQTAGQNTDKSEDDVFVTLKPVGMYYPAGSDGDLIAGTDVVAANAEPRQVYSYVVKEKDGRKSKKYVTLLSSTEKADGTVTVSYGVADIHVAIDADGDGVLPKLHEVTATIPEATAYKHIHFGVWAALGDAREDGTQDIADLGFGFVQSIGDGMTGDDMPNNGTSTFKGNWVAAVQANDEDGDGAITLDSGEAELNANFGKETITANLKGLAMLTGVISGNTFSGDKDASDVIHTSLDRGEDFEGSFSGGFYGSKAAEAGGIFDYASEDNKGGAFRGAFGANKKD